MAILKPPRVHTVVNPLDTIVKNVASNFMKDPSKMGLSIGILKDGEMFTYNYGTIEKGKELSPTQNTIYEIGSISKTFTGTLLAKAIVDKKVDLDDDIRKYLNEPYPNLEYQGKPVKILHLVTHTAGLPPFLPNRPDLFKHSPDSVPLLLTAVHKNYNKNNFLKDLHTVKLDTTPGFNYKYSNVDAQLVAFILESVYHKPFAALIKEFITSPLHMTRTEVIVKTNQAAQMAKGYSATGKVMPYMPPLMAASGGIYSSIEDMLRHIKYHLNENNAAASLSHRPVYGDTSELCARLILANE